MKLEIEINDSEVKNDMQYIFIPIQDNRIILGKFEWVASNGVRISSCGFPEIVVTNPETENEKITIFVRGTNRGKEAQANYFNRLTKNQRKKVDEAIKEFQSYEPSNKVSEEPSNKVPEEPQTVKTISEALSPLIDVYKETLENIKKLFLDIDLSKIETLTVKNFSEILEITQDCIEWDSVTTSYDSIHFRDSLIIVIAGDHLVIVIKEGEF